MVALDIVHKSCRTFLDHWRALPRRAGSIAPHAEDYLDRAPAALMSGVFIHDVLADDLIVRFMGTELVSRWQRDDTGKVFGEYLDKAARARLVFIGKTVTEFPCGMLQHGVMATTAGRETIFEAILLPLEVVTGRAKRMVIYSGLLDTFARDEHGKQFANAGKRCWIDIGSGVPPLAPPPE